MILYLLALCFCTGVLTKLVDLLQYSKINMIEKGSYFLSMLYGFLIAYIVSISGVLAPLWLGVTIGVVLAGKIDTLHHLTAIIFMVFFIFVLGMPRINFVLLFVLIAVSFIDEVLHSHIRISKSLSFFVKFLKSRLLVEITAFFISLFTSEWLLFFGILFFDIGYIIINFYRKRIRYMAKVKKE